jgi:hypothetical protein
MIGAAKNVLTQPFPRHVKALLLDKTKVNQKKQELRKQLHCSDLSSNDIITAALCQANQSSDWFVFTENARGGSGGSEDSGDPDGPGHNAAGNFLFEVPVSRAVGSQPDQLRKVVRSSKQHHHHYPPRNNNEDIDRKKGLPLRPFLHGRVGRITSLATIPAHLVYDGTEQICTIPYLSFLEKIPLDTALIFRFNQQYWGVLHNFAEIEETKGLLAELVDEGDDPRPDDQE